MDIDTSTQLVDLDGTPIMDDKQKPTTVGKVIANAVLNAEKGTSAEDHIKNYELAKKCLEGSKIKLKSDEVILVRKKVAEAYQTIIAAQVLTLIKE